MNRVRLVKLYANDIGDYYEIHYYSSSDGWVLLHAEIDRDRLRHYIKEAYLSSLESSKILNYLKRDEIRSVCKCISTNEQQIRNQVMNR